jgi:lipoprotein-releasing system ATP-binding protein
VAEQVLRLDKVCKAYNIGLQSETVVLHDIDLTLERGQFLALTGPSGSGKSTLLNIIGLLDQPTSGRLVIKGQDTGTLGDAAITQLRGHTIGFVFQDHHLISAFTALENVMMPLLVDRGFPSATIVARAQDLMVRVGLEKVSGNLAMNMSGGQQQRVAIARALAMNPDLVLADEPTGNLDTKSADSVFELMRQVNSESGTSFLMVTHNLDLAQRCDRIIEVVDGRIAKATEPTDPRRAMVASPLSF